MTAYERYESARGESARQLACEVEGVMLYRADGGSDETTLAMIDRYVAAHKARIAQIDAEYRDAIEATA